MVGESKQREYDPYADPERAVKEEFGDLLAEGLYGRLDHEQALHSAETTYWKAFIKNRRTFHLNVAESLRRHTERDKDTKIGRDVQISPELCDTFIKLWQADLVEWRRYMAQLDRTDSIGNAFRHLNLDYAGSSSPSTR
jgi:hypothetical protein